MILPSLKSQFLRNTLAPAPASVPNVWGAAPQMLPYSVELTFQTLAPVVNPDGSVTYPHVPAQAVDMTAFFPNGALIESIDIRWSYQLNNQGQFLAVLAYKTDGSLVTNPDRTDWSWAPPGQFVFNTWNDKMAAPGGASPPGAFTINFKVPILVQNPVLWVAVDGTGGFQDLEIHGEAHLAQPAF